MCMNCINLFFIHLLTVNAPRYATQPDDIITSPTMFFSSSSPAATDSAHLTFSSASPPINYMNREIQYKTIHPLKKQKIIQIQLYMYINLFLTFSALDSLAVHREHFSASSSFFAVVS